MTLMAEGGAEIRLWAACLMPALAFATAATDGSLAAVAPLFLLLGTVLVLALSQTSGSGAAWARVDSQEIVAHFTFRPSERIPLARIAAVEVRRRITWTRRSVFPTSLAFIRIFRKDMPGIIELRAREEEADAFLFTLAQNAKRLGVSQPAPFVIPRRHYVHDLVPLVPALLIVFVLPFPVSWSSFALATGVFVLHSALGWRRLNGLAKDIAAGTSRSGMQVWQELLRTT